MVTIQTRARVTPEHTITLPVPPEVPAGEHRVVLLVDDSPADRPERARDPIPALRLGSWPEGLTLRREDIYGDSGR